MDLYGLAKVAQLAEVSRPTVYDWLGRGLVTATHSVDGAPLFTGRDVQDVIAFATERRQVKNEVARRAVERRRIQRVGNWELPKRRSRKK